MSEKPPALLPLFRSQNQFLLLGELYLHPDEELSIAELVTRTGVAQQTASREIGRLVEWGLVRSRTRGRLRLVSANRDAALFDDLRGMLTTTLGPQAVLAELLADVEGIEEAYIYGSWARRRVGEAGPEPRDIDLLVVGRPDVDTVDDRARAAEQRLHREVNPTVLSPHEWASEAKGFVRELRRQPLVRVR